MAPKEYIPGVTRTNVARVAIDSVSQDALPEAIEYMVSTDEYHHMVLLRTWDIIRSRVNPQFRQCVRNASLSVPASPAVARNGAFLRRPFLSWYSPFEFVVRVLGIFEQRNRTVYLLGGDKQLLHSVEQNIKLTFPGLRIVGRYTGYYPRDFERNIVTAIKKAAPDFLLVGPGVPGRDLWVFTHRKLFNPGIALVSAESFEIFGDRRRKPPKTRLGRITAGLRVFVQKPWRALRGPVYLWYACVLLLTRIRGN